MNARTLLLVGGLTALFTGCPDDKPDVQLAPQSSGLAETKAAAGSQKFAVETTGAKVEFTMDAPIEKIRGKVADAAKGEVAVDLTDLSKTTAKVTVDISGIEIFQRRKKGDTEEFGEEEKKPLQNEHARDWLEIGPSTPADKLELYKRIEFAIKKVEGCSQNDVSKMTGAERKVTCTVTGDFLLHGRTTEKTAKVEATFRYDGDKPTGLTFTTTEPFGIGLEEHDVHPRTGFGRLAESTLETLAPKVAKQAMVSIAFDAKPAG